VATTYEDWARAHHGAAFLRRSAARNAAFLLPHLSPGQRLLDLGCGPGAITAGLADAVAPGPAVGVDRDAEFVAQARTLWTADRPNLRFEVGDATAVPLDDASVDVAFLHALLQHVGSPLDVLREVRRVVRPGGLVAVGDLDMDAYLVHPTVDGLAAALDLDRRIRRSPDVGRRLPALLASAGFDGSVTFEVRPNTAVGATAVAGVASSTAARMRAEPYVQRALDEGWVSAADEVEAMAAAWEAWGRAPGAVFTTLWCEVLAR
jgi:SAM-dependent methyltransferase